MKIRSWTIEHSEFCGPTWKGPYIKETQVISKDDLEPLIDMLRLAHDFQDVFKVCDRTKELLEAWDSMGRNDVD